MATVAHELRSPLTGVKGFVGTLLNKWDRLNDEQKQLMLRTVHSDSERLSRLITELLDVARIDTGRLPLYPREVELRPVVDRCVESVRASSPRPIETSYDEPVPVVFADPDKLVQVVTNLVDNAVRHGEGTVTVTVRAVADPFKGALIRVEDEGEGIPEEIRSRVFTKFWKHGMRGGSGLGMYIVNGFVRVHGGTVEIADADGGGARLDVRLAHRRPPGTLIPDSPWRSSPPSRSRGRMPGLCVRGTRGAVQRVPRLAAARHTSGRRTCPGPTPSTTRYR